MISLDIQSDVFERLSNAFFDSLKFKCPTAADHNITPNDPCTSIPRELANNLASTSSVRNQSGLSLFERIIASASPKSSSPARYRDFASFDSFGDNDSINIHFGLCFAQ